MNPSNTSRPLCQCLVTENTRTQKIGEPCPKPAAFKLTIQGIVALTVLTCPEHMQHLRSICYSIHVGVTPLSEPEEINNT